MMAALHELTALEAAEAINAGRVTATACVDGLLSRIEALEDGVQAWQHLDPRQARDQAARLDCRHDLGAPALNLPLLTAGGLPLGIQLTGLRFGEAELFQAASALILTIG